ncbi:hypothetical protein IMG5_006630 [Ichthyophthirius multifiliis]|uniref:Uncharacterized protein n=1 Tax=Ichthyophthirius multifiliis TaxID=5932 RepID=G0QJM7_ICHMU|nr:hypothetical protein IMG5_006630 [Ichthyophthirius multifiliis]EGR34577.1 hypothetical protein IMG5_006630 [Ichthyophthirius multifiliis]|eukprot:XP_004039881.1 hypothetical protein IMG5_006630 [Ichthyophthirius multifiliis]
MSENTEQILQTINTQNAPKAIGPYSQAKVVSEKAKLFYISGCISIDPQTNQFVLKDDVIGQTEQVMKNLCALVEAAGSNLDHVVKCNIYLDDMNNFQKVNDVYAKYFNGENKPARACIAVKGLPAGAKVEIECNGVVPQ